MTPATGPGALRAFRRPKLWLRLWWFGWCLCVALSLGPALILPIPIADADKVGHGLAYLALSCWAMMLFESRAARAKAALALVALGIAMELGQGTLTENRQMDWRDALANTGGVLAGMALAWTPLRDLLLRLDRRWFGAA